MSVGADVIARVNDIEPFKVKCKNCQGFEFHPNYYWCDYWSTTIDDADKAFCSFFTPLPVYNKSKEGEKEE